MYNSSASTSSAKGNSMTCSTLPPLRATKFGAFIGGLGLGIGLTVTLVMFAIAVTGGFQ